MVELSCECGHSDAAPESAAGGLWACPACGRQIQLACAETLPDGAGQGDFDASLTIIDGPDRVSQKILLGGVAAIEIGKADARHIHLPGQRISRNHCKLNRLDFGPSRWEVEDQNATNGTFVNGQKITKQELKPGDTLQAGEYQLLFDLAAPMQPTAVAEEEVAAALPEAQPSAPPPPPMPTARKTPPAAAGHRKGATLAYQSDQLSSDGERLLGECDPKWVMMLRNASNLMVGAICVRVGVKWWFSSQVVDVVASLMTVAAAWMLTMREPDVTEKPLWMAARLGLRIFATIAAAGDTLASLAAMLDMDVLMLPGLAMSLAGPVQTFLFLFYLRRLASRIPSPGLAISCIVVMVGLPASLGIIAYGVIMAFMNPAAIAAGGGASLATMGLGACSLIIFAIWYLIILIWFNKSFS